MPYLTASQQILHFFWEFPDVNKSQRRSSDQVSAVLGEAHARGNFSALSSAEKLATLDFKEHELTVCAGSCGNCPVIIKHDLEVVSRYLTIWIGPLLPQLLKALL